MLNLFSITIDDIEKVNRKNILNKKLRQVEIIKKLSCPLTSQSTKENIIKGEEKEVEKEKEEDKETVTNQTFESEKNENEGEQKTDSTEKKTVSKEKREGFQIKSLNIKLKFCDFLIYKITFGKRNKNFETFENFRKKILSVEHLIQNYLKINNLLNLEKRRNRKSSKI